MSASRTATLLVFTIAASVPVLAQAPTPAAGRSVTLSLAEYNRLIDLANRPSTATSVPVGAVLTSADLRVRVDRDTVRGAFTVDGEVLRPGHSRVPLMSNATLVDAVSGGRPVPLVADGAVHAALVPGPGPFSLALQWGAPVVFGPGRASFSLPVPPAGAARATIDVPGEQADVHVSAGLITSRAAVAGRTIVEATLTPGSTTEVWWSMREATPTVAPREVRTVADVMTLLTIGDSDVRMVALVDLTVLSGEPRTVGLRLPAGYELTGITGTTVEGTDTRQDGVVLTLGNPSARAHQFLVTLERPYPGGPLDSDVVSVRDVQRERGDVAISGSGTLELTIADREGLHRLDVRELNAALHSLARLPILSAFRYQRSAAAPPALALDVKRFDDAGVLAAVADYAEATTMITSEGRALTEIKLQVQNRAQSFLKVALPAGASMVSVEVAGQTAKPVLGVDGTRVPLLRPGFRPNGRYEVSFVYLHAGTPFARKGDLDMTLPRMDLPVSYLKWEVFVDERYEARAIGGNAIAGAMFDRAWGGYSRVSSGPPAVAAPAPPPPPPAAFASGGVRFRFMGSTVPGQIRGRVTDRTDAALPGVTVTLGTTRGSKEVVTDAEGRFIVSQLPSGYVSVRAELAGFQTQQNSFVFDEQATGQLDVVLDVGTLTETVTVSADAPMVQTSAQRVDRPQSQFSQNVINLQRRTVGVLPIRVDVPKAGTSQEFVKALVVDQETTVRLRYKRR